MSNDKTSELAEQAVIEGFDVDRDVTITDVPEEVVVEVTAASVFSEIEAGGNTGWDDLMRIYYETQAISTVPGAVLPLLKDPKALAQVEDVALLERLSTALVRSVNYYRDTQQAIFAKHSTRTGPNTDPDDLMRCLAIAEEYNIWMAGYQGEMNVLVANVLEMFNPTSTTVTPK